MLRSGDQGSAVFTVQKALWNQGYYIRRDGVYGPQTRAAVFRFQKNRGLLADGKVGAQTRRSLGIRG
ncbi:MAG TPA: hypothetical protein DCE56_30265 [Cyanobacteria bacterium UBA8553]|nr:hypothetical protein [Cyanobacteria bacterium UBA8553]HAJ59798.1 hypothetical protein [Cyanobacteria bacterium UBA8543]